MSWIVLVPGTPHSPISFGRSSGRTLADTTRQMGDDELDPWKIRDITH